MDGLEFLEDYIRHIDDSQAYARGQMFIELSKDKHWLVHLGLYGHIAWLTIMAGRHAHHNMRVASILNVVIHRGDPDVFHGFEHTFIPSDHQNQQQVHIACATFETDLHAVCEALDMRMAAAIISVQGIQFHVKAEPSMS